MKPKATAALDQSLIDIVTADPPMTVRQVFYQAEVAGLVPKNEEGYQQVVKRLVVVRERTIKARTQDRLLQRQEELDAERVADLVRSVLSGPSLDPDLIIDPSRKIDRVQSWTNVPSFLDAVKNSYNRDLWQDQPGALPIILIEKEALAGVVRSVTDTYGVPLIATHGSPSLTLMKDLAQFIHDESHDVALYQFGDHDPMGENIPHQIENALNMHGLALFVTREALTPQQVTRWKLPSRPTKATGNDNLGRAFQAKYGDSVELDALSTTRLRNLVETAITRHIDQAVWDKSSKRQAREQRELAKLIKGLAT